MKSNKANKYFRSIFFSVFAVGLFPGTAQAQSVSYTPLFDNSTFSRSIDLSKPVGAIEGTAGTTPSGAATYTIPIKMPPGTGSAHGTLETGSAHRLWK